MENESRPGRFLQVNFDERETQEECDSYFTRLQGRLLSPTADLDSEIPIVPRTLSVGYGDLLLDTENFPGSEIDDADAVSDEPRRQAGIEDTK